MFKRTQTLFVAVTAAVFVAGFITLAEAGRVELTVVNVETPQGVKIWVPESITANKGDTVTLKLINKLDAEHGYEIADFGIKEVVGPKATKTVSFNADKAGVFPIKCQLHPPHVAGQLVVLGP